MHQLTKILTVDDICERLKIHKSTAYRLIKAGKLRPFKIGSDYRMSEEALRSWIYAQEQK